MKLEDITRKLFPEENEKFEIEGLKLFRTAPNISLNQIKNYLIKENDPRIVINLEGNYLYFRPESLSHVYNFRTDEYFSLGDINTNEPATITSIDGSSFMFIYVDYFLGKRYDEFFLSTSFPNSSVNNGFILKNPSFGISDNYTITDPFTDKQTYLPVLLSFRDIKVPRGSHIFWYSPPRKPN